MKTNRIPAYSHENIKWCHGLKNRLAAPPQNVRHRYFYMTILRYFLPKRNEGIHPPKHLYSVPKSLIHISPEAEGTWKFNS